MSPTGAGEQEMRSRATVTANELCKGACERVSVADPYDWGFFNGLLDAAMGIAPGCDDWYFLSEVHGKWESEHAKGKSDGWQHCTGVADAGVFVGGE